MIVLASASPRRRDLLREAGLCFSIQASTVDEGLPPGIHSAEAALLLAERKARAVAGCQEPGKHWILGADTLVVLGRGDGRRFLGKPGDAAEARHMLESLSESRHRVITGVCVLRLPDQHVQSAAETTWVSMRRILPQEIEAYVESGEWRDKAGGYAIQEHADRFVTRLEEGGFDNVVGLPVGLTLELLRRCGAAV